MYAVGVQNDQQTPIAVWNGLDWQLSVVYPNSFPSWIGDASIYSSEELYNQWKSQIASGKAKNPPDSTLAPGK